MAIDYFLRQDYPAAELIVVDDGDDPVEDLTREEPRVRYIRPQSRLTLGAKRNLACEMARGEVIVHWDDDDWQARDRIRYMAGELLSAGADICGLNPILIYDCRSRCAWQFRYPDSERFWAPGTSLCYRKEFWDQNRFPDTDEGADARFIWDASGARTLTLSRSGCQVSILHDQNFSPRQPGGACWKPVPVEDINERLGDDIHLYEFETPPGADCAPIRSAVRDAAPLASCIMPTADRRRFVPLAIRYFLRQDYEPRELIIVDDGSDPVEDLVPKDSRIRYVRLTEKMPLGAKRNLACERACGDIILHWDDDDWQAPHRVRYAVQSLLDAGADVCGTNPFLAFDCRTRKTWLYRYPARDRFWAAGTSLCYRRSFWERNRFADVNVGEDTQFVWSDATAKTLSLSDHTCTVCIIHEGNISPKPRDDGWWHPWPTDRMREIMGADLDSYTEPEAVDAGPAADPDDLPEVLRNLRSRTEQTAAMLDALAERFRRDTDDLRLALGYELLLLRRLEQATAGSHEPAAAAKEQPALTEAPSQPQAEEVDAVVPPRARKIMLPDLRRPFECNLCGFLAASKDDLDAHARKHSP